MTSHVTTIFDWTFKSSRKILFPTSNSPLNIHLETFYILLIFLYKIMKNIIQIFNIRIYQESFFLRWLHANQLVF